MVTRTWRPPCSTCAFWRFRFSQPGIAVVGSRILDEAGRQFAQRLGEARAHRELLFQEEDKETDIASRLGALSTW